MDQVLRELTQKDALLDLLLVYREGLIAGVGIGGRLLVSPCRSVKGQNFTSGAKRCSQNSAAHGSASRFTTALLSPKTGHQELMKGKDE